MQQLTQYRMATMESVKTEPQKCETELIECVVCFPTWFFFNLSSPLIFPFSCLPFPSWVVRVKGYVYTRHGTGRHVPNTCQLACNGHTIAFTWPVKILQHIYPLLNTVVTPIINEVRQVLFCSMGLWLLGAREEVSTSVGRRSSSDAS